MDYGRFLVISIGTGAAKREQEYNSSLAAKWGIISWLFHKGSTPLFEIFTQSSADMIDYHNSVVFQALRSEDSYLRIQVSVSSFSALFLGLFKNIDAMRIGSSKLKLVVCFWRT